MSHVPESTAEGEEEPLNFLDLPDDCLGHVITFLPLKDKITLSRTCKALHELIRLTRGIIGTVHLFFTGEDVGGFYGDNDLDEDDVVMFEPDAEESADHARLLSLTEWMLSRGETVSTLVVRGDPEAFLEFNLAAPSFLCGFLPGLCLRHPQMKMELTLPIRRPSIALLETRWMRRLASTPGAVVLNVVVDEFCEFESDSESDSVFGSEAGTHESAVASRAVTSRFFGLLSGLASLNFVIVDTRYRHTHLNCDWMTMLNPLTNLTRLTFDFSRYEGSDFTSPTLPPGSFSALKSLRHLDIYTTRLKLISRSDSRPPRSPDFTSDVLGNLTNLETLRLGGDFKPGLDLSCCTRLTALLPPLRENELWPRLTLMGGDLSLKSLSLPASLEHLHLKIRPLTDSEPWPSAHHALSACTGLKTLHLKFAKPWRRPLHVDASSDFSETESDSSSAVELDWSDSHTVPTSLVIIAPRWCVRVPCFPPSAHLFRFKVVSGFYECPHVFPQNWDFTHIHIERDTLDYRKPQVGSRRFFYLTDSDEESKHSDSESSGSDSEDGTDDSGSSSAENEHSFNTFDTGTSPSFTDLYPGGFGRVSLTAADQVGGAGAGPSSVMGLEIHTSSDSSPRSSLDSGPPDPLLEVRASIDGSLGSVSD